ncbi:Beta-galactosidase [Cucumis melo var. makuwa]|uniref:Beta-galactosidase n=1 Tax=Cucumis melo var. makuwa TaxID=1194695 RepID=A0A5A7UCL5_CUCMM|nr:Beta-galactosidase [Cucumis melo var. makuwa]
MLHALLLSDTWAVSSHRPAHSLLRAVGCPTVKPFQPSASSSAAYELRIATLNRKSLKSVQSNIEASESSTHSKPTELSMYSKNPVHNCKQGTLDVTTYFNKLSLLWKEMDLCRETVWDTPNDGTQYAKLEEADRVYDFLAGLNPKFDTVCGCILRQRPLPSRMEVCFKVRLEEDRTNAMGVLLPLPLTPLPLALSPQIMTVTRIMGSQFLCLSTARNNGTPRISVGNSTVVPKSTSQSTDPTASETKTPTLRAIAQSSMPQSLGLISVDGKNPWILDSRATNYLKGSSEHFISYAPCASNEKIRIADGSLAPIAGKGQIVPSDSFTLQNILHVPKLFYNFLSISMITRELQCKAIFLPESVYFQT